ncbi:MAG: MBL fold metallo-hydrolase [Candidatus Eremiobacteraeota bacterium]|nr:MBL fold metallo-hydrolase [Candidatus Eremiobacteraeota bacterium]
MYRVGFGDFFLMTLTGSDGIARHILVDCGVHAANLGSISTAIDQLRKDTGGQLALIIMTHRHADHISGFGVGADVFKTFTVERVWMSYFENPNDPDAAKFQAALTAVAEQLKAPLAQAAAQDADNAQYQQMAANITGDPSMGGGNAAALKTLHGGFANTAPVDFYEAGQTPTLPDSLVKAGLTAQILGPPRDKDLIAIVDNKAHQYLAGNVDDGAAPARLSPRFEGTKADYPDDAFALFSAAQIEDLIGGNQPSLHIAMAAKADNTINNQSLVVLFTFNGKTLLFPGDAQWGNWDNWLFGSAQQGNDPQLSATAKEILGKLDFYKVGHHGSTNANPKDAVTALRKGVVAMCSTEPGAYGSVKNNSEVPRGPLMVALKAQTNDQLARADMVQLTAAENTSGKAVPPTQGVGAVPQIFKTGPNNDLYIDYEM